MVFDEFQGLATLFSDPVSKSPVYVKVTCCFPTVAHVRLHLSGVKERGLPKERDLPTVAF